MFTVGMMSLLLNLILSCFEHQFTWDKLVKILTWLESIGLVCFSHERPGLGGVGDNFDGSLKFLFFDLSIVRAPSFGDLEVSRERFLAAPESISSGLSGLFLFSCLTRCSLFSSVASLGLVAADSCSDP